MRSDGAPVRPGAGTPRVMSEAFEACKAEWDQARGHHQGQRSRERPHQQAGHWTAASNNLFIRRLAIAGAA